MDIKQRPPHKLASRFRGFLPVVTDVETGGFDAQHDGLLEMAVVLIGLDEDGRLFPQKTIAEHIHPFEGANLDPEALAFNGIDPYHPFREAVDEATALNRIFNAIRKDIKAHDCNRAIMVAHNPAFDLSFVKAASERCNIKNNPFHHFSCFDTATLGGLAFGQTVLARAVQVSGRDWDNNEAHSAIYDAEKTAQLFCDIVNLWDTKIGLSTVQSDD